jgi:hypothetical protein
LNTPGALLYVIPWGTRTGLPEGLLEYSELQGEIIIRESWRKGGVPLGSFLFRGEDRKYTHVFKVAFRTTLL